MNGRLEAVLAAIDEANAADPTLEDDETGRQPAALLYGRRMSSELARICPEASDILKIAARGQHIERWKTPRSSFPEGKAGYFAWRKGQGAAHGARLAGLMAAAGYDEADCARVGQLLRKEGLKRDAEVQMLEDVICLVFLRWYFADFAEGREPDQIFRIVSKTARKMSAEGRARVAAEFDLPPELAPALAV
ncbi:DUF4202 domain-containing protein [Denitrobaculum tricleocarpae]|uniref:DUF4202 domain-containing protein n=1 Tax=Denitrobaculum tricleocarpae TaxID=2591009 RepID=A0A545TN13_9PROT|nr:DUF4202 domain-containing protein [Denitrobaculum tricleocarpae]TQV78541.1 DUF4202 domain-containing protein [Denitrobaculum tricleocarpae]